MRTVEEICEDLEKPSYCPTPDHALIDLLILTKAVLETEDPPPPECRANVHDFKGPLTLTPADLLAQSGSGYAGVHSVDIDVKVGEATLAAPAGSPNSSLIIQGGSRHLEGLQLHDDSLLPVENFELTIPDGACVVVSWVEYN